MKNKDTNKLKHKEKMALRKNKHIEINNIRDEMNRRIESLQIIYQLKQNNINSYYPAIKELLQKLNDYVIKGEKQEFTIQFPEMKKIIKGTLPIYKNEKCVVVMKQLD